jgi:two-component system, OmpR family, osmolarity sensor histidine kinase EnvZ
MTTSARELGADPARRGPFGWVKLILPRSLFARSLLILLTPVILAQMVATFVFYDRHWETMTNRLAFAVAGEIAFVIEEIELDTNAAERSDTIERAARTADLIVTWEPGARLPPEQQRFIGMLETTLADALAQKVRRPFTINTRIAHEWYEVRVQLGDGVLRVLSPERRLFSPTTYIFILWMTGSALVLIGIAIVFLRNQIRPIRRLAEAADRFGKGREVHDYKPEGATEVRKAAAAFLLMRERIQRQLVQRTEMLAGVSHDLRTPLTRMKLQMAMMGDGPDLDALRADVAEMEMMVEGYLAFARGEGGEATAPTDLGRLVGELIADARREGVAVEAAIPDGLVLDVRPNAMRRGIGNLLANAARYAGRCWITARRYGPVVEIHVDDDGPGIAPGMREEVFRPFFRLEESRNHDTGGAGLGLAIARDVVRGHGGDLVLDTSPQGGLRATIRLPM